MAYQRRNFLPARMADLDVSIYIRITASERAIKRLYRSAGWLG
ncbi:hypothetical protein [Reyranella sp.]|nr:hypothetical protein [Reyranella sp.]